MGILRIYSIIFVPLKGINDGFRRILTCIIFSGRMGGIDLQGVKMYRFIALASLFVSSSLFAAPDKSQCLKRHCMAVIDAGSSGTRLHVYAYDVDSSNTPIQIDEIWGRKAIPGLSNIAHEQGSIGTYMEKVFYDAPRVVMPVYFYSTAGMRLLPKTQHKDINQLVAEWFDKQYYWRLETARTIPGSEEGVYGWLATNYELNLLNQNEQPPVGVMDIGGASVQIVFPIQNEEHVKSEDKVTLDLYNQHFVLFTHSFLGLGQNEMGHQYFDVNTCYPDDFELPSGNYAKGDLDECKNEISILVNQVHYVRRKVASVLANNSIEKWHLIGGITHLLNDKIFPFTDQQFSAQSLSRFADKNICRQKWSQLENNNPNHFMLFNYCMLSSYVYALIINGYGLPSTQMINFNPENKGVDWTIGVVLQHHKA